MGRFLAGLLCFCLVLTVHDAVASPTIKESTIYYPITGDTIDDLRVAMSAKGPIDPNSGAQVWGKTLWYVNWDMTYKPVAHGCIVESADIVLSIEFTYPQWVNRDDAPAHIGAEWDKFFKALVAHEKIHAGHGLAAAREIAENLPDLPAQADCDRMNYTAKEYARSVVRRFAEQDVLLDKRTRNGRDDGVTLP